MEPVLPLRTRCRTRKIRRAFLRRTRPCELGSIGAWSQLIGSSGYNPLDNIKSIYAWETCQWKALFNEPTEINLQTEINFSMWFTLFERKGFAWFVQTRLFQTPGKISNFLWLLIDSMSSYRWLPVNHPKYYKEVLRPHYVQIWLWAQSAQWVQPIGLQMVCKRVERYGQSQTGRTFRPFLIYPGLG